MQCAARPTAACPRRWPRHRARTARAGLRRTARSDRSSARRPRRRGPRASDRRRTSVPSALRRRPRPRGPSAIGIGLGRSPLMTDRSEWHRPAAAMRISTSPGPWRIELDRADRRAVGSWRKAMGVPMLFEHGGADLHVRLLNRTRRSFCGRQGAHRSNDGVQRPRDSRRVSTDAAGKSVIKCRPRCARSSDG